MLRYDVFLSQLMSGEYSKRRLRRSYGRNSGITSLPSVFPNTPMTKPFPHRTPFVAVSSSRCTFSYNPCLSFITYPTQVKHLPPTDELAAAATTAANPDNAEDEYDSSSDEELREAAAAASKTKPKKSKIIRVLADLGVYVSGHSFKDWGEASEWSCSRQLPL
jgi:hypothetical protein